MVALILLLVFVAVPILELAVIFEVGTQIGLVNTIGLLLLVSFVGAALVRHQGLATLRRIRVSLDAGVLPTPDLVDGAAILVAGALLLTPGFLTDALGLVLLFPPTRRIVRALLRRFFVGRVAIRDVRFRRMHTEPGAPNRPPDELPPPY